MLNPPEQYCRAVRTGERTTNKTNVQVFQSEFSPEDQSIPYRLVGSYEYANLLDNFTQLISISTEEEVRIYDQFLKKHPEFSYFQGLGTAFREPPDLEKADPDARARFNDRFQKGGLAWMIALARIELGATISMYGKREQPFTDIVTFNFGTEEYRQLLVDDVIRHLKSLAQEDLFRDVVDGERLVDTWTLAYLRRLKLIKDMMITISAVAEQTTIQEMRPYFDELAKHEKTLVDRVSAWLTPVVYVDRKTETSNVRASRFLGESKHGTVSALSPALIDECKRRIGQTTTDNTGSSGTQSPSRHSDSRHGK